MLREWLEEYGEALRSPPYQPEMLAAERVYIDILVDRASNIHPVTLSDRAYQIIKRCSLLPYSGAHICIITSKCEYVLEQVRKEKEKRKQYLPQGTWGASGLRFATSSVRKSLMGPPMNIRHITTHTLWTRGPAG